MKRFAPVNIAETISKHHAIADVESAAQWLLVRWPAVHQHSPEHKAAVAACSEALEGKREVCDARAAFIEAAREADILAED